MTKILVIDNYDSFVYTLNGYLQELGAETVVVRNDQIPLAELDATLAEYDGVLVSPGPGKPSDAGVSIAAVHSARKQGFPLLGVCLGHQAIGHKRGGHLVEAEPTGRQRHRRGRPRACGRGERYRWALIHPPKSSKRARRAVMGWAVRKAATRSLAILAHPSCRQESAACPSPRTLPSLSRA